MTIFQLISNITCAIFFFMLARTLSFVLIQDNSLGYFAARLAGIFFFSVMVAVNLVPILNHFL